MDNSHCAVITRPNAAMKKKLATKTLLVVTPRHSIRLNESVVSVVPNAPSANADYSNCQLYFRLGDIVILKLTPAPRDFGSPESRAIGLPCCSISTDSVSLWVPMAPFW